MLPIEDQTRVPEKLHAIISQVEQHPAIPCAIAHPVDSSSLLACDAAAKKNLINPILVGPEHRIRSTAEALEVDITGYRIIDCEHSHAAAQQVMLLARDGEALAVMKGSLSTDELMHAAVHPEQGIRSERRMSHVFVMDVPTYSKLLLISDAAINVVPNLSAKKDITQNAIDLAHAITIEQPKVAILAAIEKVKPQMQTTLDAAALCKMADRGQIQGAIVDGPLAFDNAISKQAAETKGIRSAVAGEPDILILPDLEAANMFSKQLNYLANAVAAGIVMGARVPIILTSRSENEIGRFASVALACLVAQHNIQS